MWRWKRNFWDSFFLLSLVMELYALRKYFLQKSKHKQADLKRSRVKNFYLKTWLTKGWKFVSTNGFNCWILHVVLFCLRALAWGLLACLRIFNIYEVQGKTRHNLSIALIVLFNNVSNLMSSAKAIFCWGWTEKLIVHHLK